jgi:tetratricopeptide (TPR) repeat protein
MPAGLMQAVRLLIAVALLSSQAIAAQPSAKELYDSGLRHYNVSEYDLALVDFKSAYQKSGRSELLYNIAQCYRAMGDPARALSQYRAFLRENPDAPNRPDVEKLIAAMDTALKPQKQRPADAQPRTPPAPQTEAPPPPAPAATPLTAATTPTVPTLTTSAPAPERRPAHKKGWVWGVVAGAVVLAGAGVTVGVLLGTRDTTRTLSDFRPMP